MRLKALYGLPNKVIFCKKTLISNQRPLSVPEFMHNLKSKKNTLHIDKNGISDSWKYAQIKKKINWKLREIQLLKLLEKHRGKYGEFDCIVPGSGGKDSCYASHILKYKYGMNPLTVTWPPVLKTDYGKANFDNWLKKGKFKNICANWNKDLMRLLTILSVKNLLHPFQTFILGQKNFPIKIALKKKIPLVFYGENEAEHGNTLADNYSSIRKNSYHFFKNINDIYIAGIKYIDLINNYKVSKKHLDLLMPPHVDNLKNRNINVHYLGYYLNWIPQETFYYSVENLDFRPRPFRTPGTYSKYNSIDDKLDDLHYYTTYVKFGIGRATYDVSQEIRNNHLSIEEGKKLIKKYDGEYPRHYMKEICEYLKITESQLGNLFNKFRSPHLWKKIKTKWYLRHTCNKDGTDD